MVKKQKNNKFSVIPRKWKIIGAISLSINVIILIMIISMAVCVKSGVLDYAIINTGYDKLCSDEFRSVAQADYIKSGQSPSSNDLKLWVANLDYQCGNVDASTYYSQGFNNYAHSLGLKTE